MRRYQRDVYRCTSCNGWVGRGDRFCKRCGHRFTEADVDVMIARSTFRARWNAPFHGPFDENVRCTHCQEFLSLRYKHCKRCGEPLTADMKQAMRQRGKGGHRGYTIGFLFFFYGTAAMMLLLWLLR